MANGRAIAQAKAAKHPLLSVDAGRYVTARLWLLVGLLLFYVAVPIILFLYALVDLFSARPFIIDSRTLVEIVGELYFGGAKYTSLLHSMIVPVVAVVTAATYRSVFESKLVTWLFVLPLLGVFCSLACAVIFDLESSVVQDRLLEGGVPEESELSFSSYFVGLAESLAVYVMTLVGLSLASKGGDKGVETAKPEEAAR